MSHWKTAAGPNSVPSWVANWTHTHATKHQPWAIIEVVPAQSPDPAGRNGADLPCKRIADFRAWLPADVLAIRGRVLGVLGRTGKPCCLQGKDEMQFDELRKEWHNSIYSRPYPLDAYIRAKWDLLLNARRGYFLHPPSPSQVDTC